MSVYYGFTIKNIKAGYFAPQSELLDIMYQLVHFNKGTYVDHTVETDSIGRLHIHGTMMARKGLLLSRFKRPYYHVHLDHLKTTEDVRNWELYINKESDVFYNIEKDQKEATLDIQKEYPFIQRVEVPL